MTRDRRARSARAVANDQAILEAAISEVLRAGVDHLSLHSVGLEAGLTHGASYARYEDVDELLADLWNSVLCARAVMMFELCMTAAEAPSAESVGALFDFMRNTTPADVASIRVLLTARRITTLHEVVEPFIRSYLERESSRYPDVSVTFMRGMLVFAVMIAQIFVNAQFGWDRDYQDVLETLLRETLESDPRRFVEVVLPIPPPAIPEPGDDLKGQLAYATFRVVGESGFTRATLSRIGRRANRTPGAINMLYHSKEDLVVDAFQSLMRDRWLSVVNFVEVLEEGSITQLLYSSASRENALRQCFILEIGLAAVHSEKLQIAILSGMGELEAIIPQLSNMSDDEKDRLRYLIRSTSFLTIGVTFLSTVTDSMVYTNYNQFAEPFRRAILKDSVPLWRELRRQISERGVGR
jgi:AcrR family transcriptional regulator